MNNKVLIAIVVIVILLLGGGAYIMSTKNKTVTPSTSNTTTKQEATKSGLNSLKNLLASGVPQKCTYKDSSNNVSIEGTTYISGGKVRGDFSSVAEGKTNTGHSIYDGKTSYIWSDESTTGFKMNIDPNASNATSSSETNSQQGVDMNKSIDYSCSPWLPDQSLFTPPTNITFTEFSVPTVSQGTGATGSKSLCSTCDSLTGDQKTQCLTAFKCN